MDAVFLKSCKHQHNRKLHCNSRYSIPLSSQKSTQEIHLHTLASCCIWGLILPNSDNMFIFTSIFSLIPSTEVLPNTLIDNTSPQFNINVGVEQIDKRINAFLDNRYAEGVTVPTNTGSSLMNILGFVWIIVCIGILIYAVGSYIYLHRKQGPPYV